MPVSITDFYKGLFIDHKPTGNVFTKHVSGKLQMNGETFIIEILNEVGFICEGRQIKFEDCELSRLNFTECPHCKKLF